MRVTSFVRAAALIVLLAALTAPVRARQQPPPAAPAAPPVDPARLQNEARFRELQRREQFESMDNSQREVLLKSIIDYCIELDRDCGSYAQKLKDVQASLRTEGSVVAKQQQRERLNSDLKKRALDLIAADPPQWARASQLLDQALRLSPKDPETLALKAQAAEHVQQIWFRRVALGTLVAVFAMGALVTALKTFRGGRARQLEMIEGPSPGDSFKLEKETTSLGALAAESDWVISDPARRISRRHCEISRSGKHYFLTDCSSNGTHINGKPAPKGEPVLLKKGDLIALAEDVVVRFR